MEKSHIQRSIHFNFDPAKEMQSPRFRAILRATSGRRKRHSADVKSFSHELNSKGMHHLPLQKLRGAGSPEDVMSVIYSKFSRLKQEVNSELSVYAGDLVNILDRTKLDHPEWKVPLEDLLVIAQKCSEMTPDEFWSKCEGIVQDLDDRRQEIPMGTVKQAHTRFLFILTRCTRLLQFQKESAYSENDNHVLSKHQFSDLGFYPEQTSSTNDGSQKLKSTLSAQAIKDKLIRKKLHEHGLSTTYLNHYTSDTDSPSRDRISSWKKLPSAAEKKHQKESEEELPPKKALDSLPHFDKRKETCTDVEDDTCSEEHTSKMICRVCDFEIPTLHAEGHFKICSIADRCDSKGLNVNERLLKFSEVLEKILESEEPTVTSLNMAVSSVNSLQSLDLYETKQSSEIMTPTSPLPTPHSWHLDLLLTVKRAYSELENLEQVSSLLEIVRSIMEIKTCDYNALESLSSHLEELSTVIDSRNVDALIVETFGRRIVKLLREKFIHLCGKIDDENKESSGVDGDEEISVENGSSHSSHPLNTKLKDRTSIEDFEIIKPISRGAFGRVFLAKKRVTGDLFAIKVLKKADMIRKNAVESILAERNILISVRNPFVVRFYYSFTCRENLYLVMEYLNGGDLYSLLRNLGCLGEEMAQTYIAELVLALEYLHSMNIIHRDLKPDNLLIGRDGHIKLTDFGLSKVGLINSTDDLTGPDVSSAVIFDDHKPMPASVRAQIREQRQKQTAVGTPDYLAPEILLGMTHGPTADWWSVGVILFELLVGIPPFNAEHPQKIFDNIMNRDIPWPQVPDEISHEAYDLINKLLIQNPFQRLGATGATEVKAHPFFKSICWDMLAEKRATFIPSTESEDDTSYFTCRHAWNSEDAQIRASPDDFDDTTDTGSMSCSSSPYSYDDDDDDYDDEDECGSMEEFGVQKKYSFSNFSFKNISQLASMNYDIISKTSEDEANATNS